MQASRNTIMPWSKCTLGPLVDEYVRSRKARGIFNPKTARQTHYILISFAQAHGGRSLKQLNRATVERFMEVGHLAPSSRRIQLSMCKTFCDWLVEQGKIRMNPAKGYPPIRVPRKVPVTFTWDEVGRLIDACQDDLRMLAMVWLMVGVGARCCEVSRLDVDDYDRRVKMIRLTGKGGHTRDLPVPDEVCEALDAYLALTGRRPGPMIRRLDTRGGHDSYERLASVSISGYLTKIMRTANVKTRNYDGKSAHGLRRTAASDVMDKTRDIQIVQALLGHARIETTTLYVRPVSLDSLRDAMAGRTYDREPVA